MATTGSTSSSSSRTGGSTISSSQQSSILRSYVANPSSFSSSNQGGSSSSNQGGASVNLNAGQQATWDRYVAGLGSQNTPTSQNIGTEAMRNSPQIQLGNVAQQNQNFAGILQGLSQNSVPQTMNQQIDQNTSNSMDMFNQLQNMIGDAPSSEDAYKKAQRETGILQKQQAVNDLSGQLNQIVAQGQAQQLQVVGQGRGIPEAIIGGQQAQIARESAIQALPVSAQLQAAQGNLQSAEQNLNTLFKIYSDDATNKFNQRKEMYTKFFDIASAGEQKKMELAFKMEERGHQEKQSMIQMQNNYANSALQNNQGALAGRLATLNPESPNYKTDLAKMISQIAQAPSGSSAPTVKSINGVDMQWNPKTSQWENIGGGTGGSGTSASIDQLSMLRESAKRAKDLAKASGTSGVSRKIGDWLIGDTKYRQLEAYTDTLRTNVLTLMTDPSIKKFFGPQMSEADVRLMTSAGTTMNPQNNSPQQMRDELKRLDQMFNRMETAVRNGQTSGNTITAPDGDLIIITN